MEELALNPTQLLIAAALGMILLLVLIIRYRLQAMLAILIGSVFIGLAAGMPFDKIIESVNDGMGNTLKGIALLVGIGSMFGAILEISGGAQRIALTLVEKFGEERSAWALGITGLVIAIPVFFDAGLIILIPLAFSLARRTQKSSLYYIIPLLAGLAVGHAFIPPTPGPVLVANLLGVELGWVIVVGLICGTFSMLVAGIWWGKKCGDRFFVPAPTSSPSLNTPSKLPSFTTVASIILIPLLLIILKSLASVWSLLEPAKGILTFLGEPFVALTLSTLIAMFLLGHRNGYSNQELEKVMTKSLEPVGLILLVTACGGVLRYILQNSGLGDLIGNYLASSALPLIIVAFIVAALVRISVGSATVAMTMAAGILAAMPEISSLSQWHLACITAAIAGGATVCSHFNDSGFWLVRSLTGMNEKTTLRTWTIMETLVGTTGFIVALVLYIIN